MKVVICISPSGTLYGQGIVTIIPGGDITVKRKVVVRDSLVATDILPAQ
jgi:hypothetical protein